MTILSRLILNNPALGTAGGSTLYAQVEALYQKIGDSVASRFFKQAALASAASVDFTHNYQTAFSTIRYDLYTYDTGTNEMTEVTATSTPSLSQFAILATPTALTTQIRVTNNTGSAQNIVLICTNDPIDLREIRDVDLITALPQDGQALVYSAATGKWAPGASGDASFKLQSVTTPNLVIKGGYIVLDDGRELATYSGTGSVAASFGTDITVSLTTIFGSAPANATTYYLYIDLQTLASAATTTTDTGRKLTPITVANFVLLTTTPDLVDRSRYLEIGLVRSATTGTVWSGAGSAFATLAYRGGDTTDGSRVPTRINYTPWSDGEQSLALIAPYLNTAQATPVTGTGGSPTVTVTRNTTNPLAGLADIALTKPATNCQGQGWAIPFSVPRGFRAGRSSEIEFLLDSATSTAYVAGDLAIYVYDITAGLLLTPMITAVPSAIGTFKAAWFSTSGSSNYRLIFHIASTNATAWTVNIDNVVVGPGSLQLVPAVGEYETINTFVVGGSSTAPTTGSGTTYLRASSRDGEYLLVHFSLLQTTAGTAGVGDYLLPLPNGLTINYAKAAATATSGDAGNVGYGTLLNNSTRFMASAHVVNNGVYAGKIYVNILNDTNGYSTWSNNYASLANTTVALSITARIPINEWAGNGVIPIGAGAAVEYASNSSTSATANDTTSFSSAPGQIGSITVAGGLGRRVRFQYPIQPGDLLTVQISSDGLTWSDMEGSEVVPKGGPAAANCFVRQNGVLYGLGRPNPVSGITTDVDVVFGQYALASGSTFGAAGQAWSAGANLYYWRVRKASASAPVGITGATNIAPGLVRDPKQYVVGTAYTNGTISISGTGLSAFTVIRGLFLPYQSSDGAWRLKFNFTATFTGTTTQATNMVISGITFKNISGFTQACAGGSNTNGYQLAYAMAINNSGAVEVYGSATSHNNIFASGDVELDSKPTWAD